jgi:anti-sigma B factor antagonist
MHWKFAGARTRRASTLRSDSFRRRWTLRIKADVDGDTVVVSLTGKLMGGPESEALRAEIKKLLDDGVRKFIINMKGVPWINSTGLGSLMAVYASIQRAQGALRLCHVSDRVQSLFMITKLLTIFETFPDEAAAKAALK